MKLEDIKSIGVMGVGIMGAGITQTAIVNGYKVIARDITDEILDRAKDTITNGRFGLQRAVETGKMTQEQMYDALENLVLTTKVEDLKDCDFVIEAIGGGPSGELENKDIKLRVFLELDEIIKKEAVFATNTSNFSISDLAIVTERKPDFIGMHWFVPATVMEVVEVVWTQDNSEETIKLVEDMCDKFGKLHVRVKDVPGDNGHVGNRIFYAARNEASRIVEQGICTAEGVNTIMKRGFNWPMGPLVTGANTHRNREKR